MYTHTYTRGIWSYVDFLEILTVLFWLCLFGFRVTGWESSPPEKCGNLEKLDSRHINLPLFTQQYTYLFYFWRLIKVTVTIFKSRVSYKSARILIPDCPPPCAGTLLFVCLFVFLAWGILPETTGSTELPSREGTGSASTGRSVTADETQLHFNRSVLSALHGHRAKRWQDEIQTCNISSIFHWLAYSCLGIYFYFWAKRPNIMDSVIFPQSCFITNALLIRYSLSIPGSVRC